MSLNCKDPGADPTLALGLGPLGGSSSVIEAEGREAGSPGLCELTMAKVRRGAYGR